MALADIIKADFASIVSDMDGPTFHWQGEDYSCAPGYANNALVLGEGGFETTADLVLYASTGSFSGVFPKSQQTLTYNSKSYRIARVTTDPLNALVELVCVSATRGV